MCIREIPSRRIDCFFFREGLRQSGADRQGVVPTPLHCTGEGCKNTDHGRGLSLYIVVGTASTLLFQ